MKKRSFNAVFCAVIAWLFCGGCGDSIESDESVFRYNESANLNSLDPAFARSLEPMWVVDQLFDGLVELDAELQIRPVVAREYFISDSGRTWTFILRDDVYFSPAPGVSGLESGRRVVAQDVIYSLNRLRDPAVASSGKWILDPLNSEAAGGGISAIGSDTIRFELTEPFPPFLGLLATAYANIVPKEAVQHYGEEFRRNPIGSGPFQLAWWMEDVACVLHANPLYWEFDDAGKRLPYLEAVHISFVSDMGAEFQGLLQGRYDFVSGFHASYMNEVLDESGELREKFQSQLRLETTPFLKTDYIGFMVENQEGKWLPWQDKAVRQALSLAVDREGISMQLRRGTVVPTSNFVPPALLRKTNHSAVPMNQAKAKQILDSVQIIHPLPWPELVVSTTSDYTDLCAALQYQWQALGLDVAIDVISPSTHRERVAQGQAIAFRKSWLADYPDAENFLAVFHSQNFAPEGPNYSHYSNSNFDLTLDSASIEMNDSIRMVHYKKLDKLIASDLPIIPLFHDRVTHFVRQGVEGWEINAINRLDLRRVKKSSPAN
ncbi:MAG: ABC transporter substrate-binding protein [Bacteroidetes bacterium]|nr:ABC transporter substrate-binding protein [Bacteroidota bacterium]MDA1335675.1 ABC transporter substrate-binding protein [Bacteroidota bacterium]